MKDDMLDSVVSKGAGRNSDYTDDIANEICSRISEGRSVHSICKDKDMPSRPTFYKWLADNESFLNKYNAAVEQRADYHFDEMIDIADKVEPESAEVAKARLQIDTRKWIVARMRPRKYGDNIQEDDGNNDNVQPVQVTVNVRDARKPDA